MKLGVGDRVTMELLESRGQYPSLVQAVGDGVIRLAAPMRRGEIVRPRPRERLIIWLARPDAVYGFDAVALRLDLSAQPSLLAAAATAVRRLQRRDDVREWMSIEPREVQLDNGTEDTRISAIILNVSAAGVLLSTPARLTVGDRLWLSFELPGGAEVEADAEVRRVDEPRLAGASGYRVGARFTQISHRSTQAIVRAIYHAQAGRRRKEKGRTHDYGA